MSDDDYVQIGHSIARLEPTNELRWVQVPHTTTAPAKLQQKWVAKARLQDSYDMEEHRWRDVPLVIEPQS